jgi:small subunit ribosomal protein S1
VVLVGDEIDVMILDIDEDRRRISLGMKQCTENPWDVFAGGHAKGERIKGRIKSITDFGLFIGLDGNIDGLVHLSDISWHETGEEAVRNYKKGDEVETIILAIDPERERISLGIKQMEGDPFTSFVTIHDKGSIVVGKVVEIDAKAALIQLADDVQGVLKASEISRDRVEDARNAMALGDEVEAKIINVDRKNRVIGLSIKAKDVQDEKEAMKALREQEPENAPTTIGDLIKAQMSNRGRSE